jgi:hypothetical protein
MVHSPAPNSVSKTTRADSNRSRSGGGSVHRKRWGRGFVHCASQARMLSSMVAVRTPPNSWAVLTVRPPGAARRAAFPTRPAPRLQRSASGIAQVGEVLLNPEAPDNFCRPWSRSRKSPRSAGGDRRTGARSPSAFGPALPSMISRALIPTLMARRLAAAPPRRAACRRVAGRLAGRIDRNRTERPSRDRRRA